MGHNIPTFFFPVHKDDLKGSELSEEFVQELLGNKYDSRFDEGRSVQQKLVVPRDNFGVGKAIGYFWIEISFRRIVTSG